MTPEQLKDIFWQYHLWHKSMTFWQRLILPIKERGYISSWEYFFVNIYKAR